MSRFSKIYMIAYIFSIVSMPLAAESAIFSEQSSSYDDHYGIINAIYTEESRLVISDVSLIYDHASGFYKRNGSRIKNFERRLKPGTPVIYHYYQQAPNLVLKDLKIVSMREYKKSLHVGTDNQ